MCSWYKGPSFIEYIDSLPDLHRNANGPFLMPVVERFSDRGTIALGKVESGSCKKGNTLLLMPNKAKVTVDTLWRDEEETEVVRSGENIRVRLRGVEEMEVAPGFVLCNPESPCKTGRVFDAQVVLMECHSIICVGYKAVCHIHSVMEEVTVKILICTIDKKSGQKAQVRPRFVKQDQLVIMRLETSEPICMEAFKDYPQLGRFTLRDEDTTIAFGKIMKVIE